MAHGHAPKRAHRGQHATWCTAAYNASVGHTSHRMDRACDVHYGAAGSPVCSAKRAPWHIPRCRCRPPAAASRSARCAGPTHRARCTGRTCWGSCLPRDTQHAGRRECHDTYVLEGASVRPVRVPRCACVHGRVRVVPFLGSTVQTVPANCASTCSRAAWQYTILGSTLSTHDLVPTLSTLRVASTWQCVPT